MKTKTIIYVLVVLLVSSCKPHVVTPPPTEDGVDLTIKFRPTFVGNNLSWLSQYITGANDSVTFDKVKFILSGFTLEKTDGKLVSLNDAYAYISLKDGRDSIVLRNVPKNEYKSIRFRVGLDSVINHSDPSKWALTHALSPSLNEMHWGWSGGYIFNVIEGYYRKDGTNAGFSFHVATDKHSRIHSFVYDYNVNKASRFVFEVKMDKYFSNVVNYSLKTDGHFSHSGEVDPVMDKFIQNMNGIFELESFH
jgi:hypothetical protein